MNEQKFERRMERRWERYQHRREHGGRWFGLFLLVLGGLFLAKASGVLFPGWFFTWPVLLIGFGIFSGIRHGFRAGGWIVPILVGGLFLADRISPGMELRPYIWPIALIAAGLLFLLRPRRSRWQFDETNGGSQDGFPQEQPPMQPGWPTATDEGSDVIDATAILGGIKKNVLSKNFKGGDITTFMGGAEINLARADFSGKVMLDCFNMFGGTKLIVPADWEVQSGLVTIFGGIEDKRQPAQVKSNKVLYLDGTCIFGGIEIRSY